MRQQGLRRNWGNSVQTKQNNQNSRNKQSKQAMYALALGLLGLLTAGDVMANHPAKAAPLAPLGIEAQKTAANVITKVDVSAAGDVTKITVVALSPLRPMCAP